MGSSSGRKRIVAKEKGASLDWIAAELISKMSHVLVFHVFIVSVFFSSFLLSFCFLFFCSFFRTLRTEKIVEQFLL